MSSSYAQEKNGTQDSSKQYEQRLNEYLQLVPDQVRLDVEGFLLYVNTDSIPQDVFLIPYSRREFDETKSLEGNFLRVLSQPNVLASEEVFMSMRWTMPTLLDELGKCTHLLVDSNFRPALGGLPLRVVYGKIVYRVRRKSSEPSSSTINSISLKIKTEEYTITVKEADKYGSPDFFVALK